MRTAAGLFDISHMAEFLVEGADAGAFLDYALAGRLSTLADDRRSTACCSTWTAGSSTTSSSTATRDERFMVVANAGNRDAVRRRRSRSARSGSTSRSTDATDDIALIAVQGPAAQAIVEATTGIAGIRLPLGELKYYRMTHADYAATGVDAVPCSSAAPATPARTASSSTSAPRRRRRCGTRCWRRASRSASFPRVSPRATRCASRRGCRCTATSSRATSCPRRRASAASSPPTRTTSSAARGSSAVVASRCPGARRPRRRRASAPDAPATPCYERRRRAVGEITSGALSPTLGHPIAMAFVSPRLSEPGTELTIDVRGTRIPATVTALPFYRRNK